ncbi:MAG: hypothetical protein ACYCQJ_09415 [Nitrososphaerales archaeon]
MSNSNDPTVNNQTARLQVNEGQEVTNQSDLITADIVSEDKIHKYFVQAITPYDDRLRTIETNFRIIAVPHTSRFRRFIGKISDAILGWIIGYVLGFFTPYVMAYLHSHG